MRTKTNISTNTTNYNELNNNRSFIYSVITATLLALLLIGLADKIDTGIDIALLTQQAYKIQFVG